MARKKKEPEIDETSNSDTSHAEKKRKITGLLLMVLSVFIFFSIISFSNEDDNHIGFKISEVTGIQSMKDLQSGNTQNILVDDSAASISYPRHTVSNIFGIWGAYIAYFFVKKTLGYLSIVFPLLLFMWAYSYFQTIELKRKLQISSFVLFNALCFSALLGLLCPSFYPTMPYIAGSVGIFTAIMLMKMAGTIGAVIIIFTMLTAVYVYVFDMQVESAVFYFRDKIKDSLNKDKTEPEDAETVKVKTAKNETSAAEKPKKKTPKILLAEEPLEGTVADDETEESTVIRINKQETAEAELKKGKKDKAKATGDEDTLLEPEDFPKPAVKTEQQIQEEEESIALTLRQGEELMPEPWEEDINYKMPSLNLLDDIPPDSASIDEDELRRNAEQLKEKLALFDIKIDDIEVTPGPVVTLYEIRPAPGVKISRIVSLENDIALALAAKGIRIIAPIPGKSAIGVEIPNQEPCMVVAKSVLKDISKSKAELPLALGKTISGEVYVTDLAKMPHLLVAGSTGSGKSVGINMMLATLLFSRHPYSFKVAIIDPKKIELSFYQSLRQHYLAICPDIDEDIVTVPMNAIILLKSIELEMEKRYDMLAKAGVRNIIDYNTKIADPARAPKDSPGIKHHFLPYLVVVIDELADLMITAGKEVEEPIARLAQLARAVGIHLIVATQRPSVNVITGVIKANLSTRISYQVATKIDSRTILDMNGAEQLLGKGDMLFLPPGSPKPIRLQNAFISTEEVERLTGEIEKQEGYSKPYYLPSIYDKKQGGNRLTSADLDPLFEDAAKVVVQHQQGSVSLLQRRLKLGYARAARIVDQLEEAGIVGPNDGSKARQVLVDSDEMLETILRNL
ncbi:MAG: DNA translocase FtsK [Ignavibacteria bacterium]|nr:DNA translocase FtsK [Ignavibacteria bacterium]